MDEDTAKKHIQSLYEDYEKSSTLAKSSLSGAINRLQKAFPKRGHFLMEFIQNADDCKSELLKIEIDDKSVKIYNSGNQFNEKDVTSISQVGQSSKNPEDYVGYLGVGFKSVFLISDEPHIYSGPFKFKFDKKCHVDPSKIPWQIMPIWDANIPPNTEVSWWKTSFYLPFNYSDQKNIEKIREEIETESINSRLLLFLKYLRQIEIYNKIKNSKRVMKKSQIIESNQYYEIWELIEEQNGQENKSKWVLFRNLCRVPDEVKNDNMTIEWERQNVQKREIIAAFRLDENNDLVDEKGAAHIGVFSFLPIKEDIEGISFLIQGDFLTAPGRETLSRDALWNKWLCIEISKLIKEKCVPIFINDERWKMRFANILYSEKYGSASFFDVYLKKEIVNFINQSAVLIAEDNSPIKVSDTIRLSDEVKDVVDQHALSLIFPNKKILNSKCLTTKISVKESPDTLIDMLLDSEFSKILIKKSEEKDIEWFMRLYTKLFTMSKTKDQYLEPLKSAKILLTNDFELSEASRVLLPTKSMPQGLEHNFKLIHHDFMNNNDILEFLKTLGAQEVTDELIRQLMTEKQIPEIASRWDSISEEEKLEKIHFLYDIWKKGKIKAEALSFLTLKSKDGQWKKATELKFGSEYSPEIDLERIVQRIREKIKRSKPEVMNTINQKLDNDLIFSFISPTLFPNNESESRWQEFLKELGVDNFTDQEKRELPHKLSVIYVLIIEDREGHSPRELTESEKRGYDIVSKSEEKEIKIEVKGSEKSSPNLFLPPHEYAALLQFSTETDSSYWCYMVTKVFGNAELYRMRGEDIKNVSPGINLAWNQIRNISKRTLV